MKKLYVYDPVCSENSIKNQLKNRSIKIKDSINSALEETDVLVIATEWKSFRKLDLSGTNHCYEAVLPPPVPFGGRYNLGRIFCCAALNA